MKILIVGPYFFSYISAVANEINARQIGCMTFNEIHSDGILTKIAFDYSYAFSLDQEYWRIGSNFIALLKKIM